MKQIRNNSAQESKLELWRWDVNQSEQKLLVLGFLHSCVWFSQWKGHYRRCAAIDGDTGQWQMSWCPLLIITCGALTSQTIVQRGRVTAILVLNQLQQIFCLQATNYRGSHTTPESRNSILRMNDTKCPGWQNYFTISFISQTAPGHKIKGKIPSSLPTIYFDDNKTHVLPRVDTKQTNNREGGFIFYKKGKKSKSWMFST